MPYTTHLVIPSRRDIKAARNYLEWSQQKLGEECDSTEYTINSLEKKRHKPTKELLDKVTEIFAEEGIRFNPTGGFRIEKDIVKVYEGNDCYLKLMDNILQNCTDKDEVLFLGCSDKKSSERIIKIEQKLYNKNISCKYLIENSDNYIVGPWEDYRQIDKNNFLSNNVVALYKNKVAFPSVINKDGVSTKTILITDDGISSQLKKYFYFLWNSGKKITSSDVKQKLFKNKK